MRSAEYDALMGALPDFVTANTILYCRDWDATVRFYRDGLGLPVTMANNWFVEFALTDTARLSVADERRATIRSCRTDGLTIALQVSELETARAGAVAAGLEPTEIKDHPWNARVFYLRDPEGHRVEIWEPVS